MSASTSELMEEDQDAVILITGCIPSFLVDGSSTTEMSLASVHPTLRSHTGNLLLAPVPFFQGNEPLTIPGTYLVGETLAKLGAHNKGKPIAGVVHLHDISEKRLVHAVIADLEMLEAIVGKEFYHRIVFGTIHWNSDKATELHGETREKELKDTVWRPFIDGGAQVVRLDYRKADEEVNDVEARESMLLAQISTPTMLVNLIQSCKEEDTLLFVDELTLQNLPFSKSTVGTTLARVFADAPDS